MLKINWMKQIFYVKNWHFHLILTNSLNRFNQTSEPLEMFRESVKPNFNPIDILSRIVNEIFNEKGF